MRLVRNNADDSRVAHDLALLAEVDGDAEAIDLAHGFVADVPPTTADGADDDDAAPADSDVDPAVPVAHGIEDPFARRFVQLAVHGRRYAPFYAGAFAWLFVIALIQPVGGDGDGRDEFTSASLGRGSAAPRSSLQTSAAAVGALAAEAPRFDTFGGSTSGSTALGFADFDETSFGSDVGSPESPAPAFDDEPLTFAEAEFEDEGDDVDVLEIVASGYASATGGTPLEQEPPGKGLPVAAAGGRDAKRSFIRLQGAAPELRLMPVLDEGANINDTAAAIKMCPITVADWKPMRGQALADAPAFDANTCQAGVRHDDRSWTFDLGIFGVVADHPGYALTMGVGATGNTFQVVFQPEVVPASG